jgi:hypothetical protein
MKTRGFGNGVSAMIRSSGEPVVAVDLSLPPSFQGLSGTELFYMCVLFAHVLEPEKRGFVVDESDLDPPPISN